MYNFEPFYRIKVDRVVDGDTLVISFHLGLGIWLDEQKVRLIGINAPEMKGESKAKGEKVKLYLAKLIASAEDIIVRTDEKKKGKYGRFLVVVYGKYGGKWQNLNQKLVQVGAAVEYMVSSQVDVEEIFNPAPEDIEDRVKVNERRTEDEIYREVKAMLKLAKEVLCGE